MATGGDLLVRALEAYGVEHVFGNPGTTELPILRALKESEIEYVLGLHEDIAVGMAAGYASTRRYHAAEGDATPVGVANLHVTPGLAHGLGNLYNAYRNGAPLVVTAGNHARNFRHEEPILAGDLVSLAEEVTKWSDEVLDVDALPTMLRRAFRTAMTPPTGPVFLALPLDVTRAETGDDPERLGPIPDAGRGDAGAIARAADLLAAAEEPVLVAGDWIARSDAVDAAVSLAEAAGARVHGEILATEVSFPADHDQWAGHLPPSEEPVARRLDADAVVFAGCSSNTTIVGHEADLVPEGTACVHLGPGAWELGKNHPADAAVIGDPGAVLGELADRVRERLSERERATRRRAVVGAREEFAPDMGSPGTGGRPSVADLVDALREAAPGARVVDESITAKPVLLSRWALDRGGLLSNGGGGLGYGLPAAVGAAIAESDRPDPRPIVGFIGDGTYLYYPHALYTAAREGVDLTVAVPDNREYRILKENAQAMFGGDSAERDVVGTEFDPPVDIAANAESHGARGRRIEDADALAGAIEDALAAEGPVVLDVLVD